MEHEITQYAQKQAEIIINLKNEENVYRASLAGGARIIMPTLLDFLR